MAKNKLINSGFWSDPFIEELPLQEKALFLYFITNELVSLSGIYLITKKRMLFDTGIKEDILNCTLKLFSENNKIYWLNNYLFVVNFLKYQKPNTKTIITIKREVSVLPKDILLFLKDNLDKFDSLSIGYPDIETKLDTHLRTRTRTKTETKTEKGGAGGKEKPTSKSSFKNYLKKKIIENNMVETEDKIFEFYLYRMAMIKSKRYKTEKGIDGLISDLNGCRDAGMIIYNCIEKALQKEWMTPDPSYFKKNNPNNNHNNFNEVKYEGTKPEDIKWLEN